MSCVGIEFGFWVWRWLCRCLSASASTSAFSSLFLSRFSASLSATLEKFRGSGRFKINLIELKIILN